MGFFDRPGVSSRFDLVTGESMFGPVRGYFAVSTRWDAFLAAFCRLFRSRLVNAKKKSIVRWFKVMKSFEALLLSPSSGTSRQADGEKSFGEMSEASCQTGWYAGLSDAFIAM